MIFFSSFDSALGTDSFDTKINDFDENFGEYDIDGRPFSEAKSRDTQNSNVSQPIQPFDPSFKSPPLTNYDEISKSKNPRLSPVGPDSSDSKLNNKTFTTHLNPPPKSNSIDLPDSFSLPHSSKIAPKYSLNPQSLLRSDSKKPEPLNFNHDDTISNQMISHPKENSINHSRTSDSDYSDDEIDARPKDVHVDGSEIILKADTHYNPVSDKDSPNPEWFIITADPQLTKHTPLVHTNSSGVIDGVLVARGQLKFIDGQPSIDPSVQVLPVTQDEVAQGSVDPESMIDPSSVPCEPFYFNQKEDIFVQQISAIFNEISVSISFNYNTSNTLNFQDNSQTHWTNVTNNFLVNMFSPSLNPISLTSNQIEVKEQAIDTPVQLTSNNLSIEESTIDTSVNLFSNKLSVNESTIDTSVNLLSNKITPKESTISTPVSLVSNKIVTNLETVINQIDIESNKLDIKNKVIKSTANIVSNEIVPKYELIKSNAHIQQHEVVPHFNTVKSDAIIQQHEIVPKYELLKSDAHIQQHEVVPLYNTVKSNAVIQQHEIEPKYELIKSDAHIQQHEVVPLFNTVKSNAIIQQHEIEPNYELVKSDAHIQQHEVIPHFDTIKSNAIIQHHKVDPNFELLKSNALIQEHEIIPNYEIIKSPAHIQEHQILPSYNTVTSEALVQQHVINPHIETIKSSVIIQNHEIDIKEKTIKSVIEVPKFVFEINEKAIPITCNSHCNYLSSMTHKFLTVSNSSCFSSDASFSDDHSQSSNQPQLASSNPSATENSYSNGSSSEANGDRRNDRNDSSSSSIDGCNSVQWIIDRLKQVHTKSELENLIYDVQNSTIDLSHWNSCTSTEIPIIIMMFKTHNWLNVGTFYCPHCEESFSSPAALHAHWKTHHGKRILPNEHAAIEHVYSIKMRWKITDDDLPEDMPRYRNIWACPSSDCNYIVNNANSLACHIKYKHTSLEVLRLEVGLLWASIIMFAKEKNKLMSANDLFNSRNGSVCMRCKHFIGQDNNKVQQHTKSSHPAANIEGCKRLVKPISLKACWMDELIDDDSIKEADNDLDKEIALKDKHIIDAEHERNLPAHPEDINTNVTHSADERRRKEHSLRERRAKGILIASDSVPENRLHNNSTDDNDNSIDEDVTPTTNCNNYNIVMSDDDLQKFFQKSRGWIDKNNDELNDVVLLPKIWGDRLMKFKKKFDSFFKDKISSLLNTYDSIISNKHFNLVEKDKMILWEGILAKIHLMIRKKIRECLHIPKFNQEKSKKSNRIPKSLELPIQLKSATKFTASIELIHNLLHKDDEIDQPTLNVIADLKDKAVNFLSRAPEDFTQYLGGDDLDKVNALLDAHNFDEKLQFLHSKLEELEILHCNNSSAAYKKFIQKAYSEDAKKTLDWFVLGGDSPECTVPLENFIDDYGSAWKDVVIPNQNEEFKLSQIINDDDNETFNKLLLDEKAIQSAIGSRSNLSAVGCDGICNGVWKICKDVTSRIIKTTIQLMLSSGKFPSNLKACKTVMLYKKGDPNLTRSWRPITITSTLYRMLMCHISRSMQTLNSQRRFICEQQKGFMKIPAGAAEHLVNADEMIHHAVRHKRNIYIVTIDFKDAFGSVPHELIKRNLSDVGFSKTFVKAIMSSYKECYTRIVSNGGMSEAIPFGKGVKQGCPLSPTLFNICLEPLLQKLNNKAAVDGYHWYDNSTSVQAYADDVILFSDTEKGMWNLIKTVEDFCHYAGNMVINPKKCSSLSFVISNGLRSTISNNFSIGSHNDNDDSNFIENINLHSYTPYLGLPLATHVNNKKRHVFQKIITMRSDINKISSSSLKTTQVIDAIKRFIIPKLDYELLINAAPINKLKELDAFIRKSISKKIGSHGLPIDWFYSAKKDGGLNLQSIFERYNALKIRLYVGLRESKDERIRRMIISSDNDEMTFRDAVQDPNSPFLNVPTNESGCIHGRRHCGTSNTLNRTVKALHDMHFGLTFKDNVFKLVSLDSLNHSIVNQDKVIVNSKNIMKAIMKFLQSRHFDNLINHPLKGHSFVTLRNSPISSFFVNPKAKAADSVTNFAFRARLGSLFTGNLQYSRSNNQDINVRLCPRCNEIETQHHLLNGCKLRKQEFTQRHDEVVKILRNFINDKKKVVTHANQVVRGHDSERLTGPNAALKPDLWFWDHNKLFIIEFTIPYGMKSDVDDASSTTLELRRSQKLNKYIPLLEDCKQQFHCDAELLIIIVSSLGAVPKETIDDVKKIAPSDRAWKKIVMKMVMTSIRESMFIYLKWHPNAQNPATPVHVSNSVTITEQDDVEEDDDQLEVDHSMNAIDDSAWKELIDDSPSNSSSSSNVQSSASDLGSPLIGCSSDTDALESPGLTPYWKDDENENGSNLSNLSEPSNSDSVSTTELVQGSAPSEDGSSCE